MRARAAIAAGRHARRDCLRAGARRVRIHRQLERGRVERWAESPAVTADFLKFAHCMRSHGVPNFPDPSRPGIQLSPGSGLDPASPAFQVRAEDMQQAPAGRRPKSAAAAAASASDVRAALAWAQCVRKHGVPNFPDPSTSAHAGPVLPRRRVSGRPGVQPPVAGVQAGAGRVRRRPRRPPARAEQRGVSVRDRTLRRRPRHATEGDG